MAGRKPAMSTVWTAVFVREGFRDTPEDRLEAFNGLSGAAVYRALCPVLTAAGWPLHEAEAEDHGWDGGCMIEDQGRRVAATLIVAPNEDGPAFENGPPDPDRDIDHWRIVIAMNLGFFNSTKARRLALFKRFATEVEAAVLALGGRDFEWQEGGPR
jgi:hypothetical protein